MDSKFYDILIVEISILLYFKLSRYGVIVVLSYVDFPRYYPQRNNITIFIRVSPLLANFSIHFTVKRAIIKIAMQHLCYTLEGHIIFRINCSNMSSPGKVLGLSAN